MTSVPTPLYDAYARCPRCAGPLDRAVDGGGARCPACGFRVFFSPCIAAGTFPIDGEGRLLLIRRARDPGRGKLGMPGGFVDRGEDVEGALRREMREEVGLECARFEYLSSCPNDYHYGGIIYPVVDLFFVGRMASFDGARINHEVAELVVARPGEIDPGEYAFESMRRAHTALLARISHTGA